MSTASVSVTSGGPAGATSPRILSLNWQGGTVVLTGNENERVRFVSPEGKLKITFLSPFGDDTITVDDTQDHTFKKGGIYQFRCTVNDVQIGRASCRERV